MKNKTRHVFQAVLAYFKHHLEKNASFIQFLLEISCNFFSLINPGQGNAGQYLLREEIKLHEMAKQFWVFVLVHKNMADFDAFPLKIDLISNPYFLKSGCLKQ